ncbi:MAG: CCA tRNA nucleotidyltransferase [Thermoprotei archaeon]|nr:CCA tRNA nucleotidyltransferase [Thermoprotei archaeon]
MVCIGGPLEALVESKLRPSRVQLRILEAFYQMVKRKLEGCLGVRGLKVHVEAEGSYAKGTLLSGKWELDIFVLFGDVDDAWVKGESLRVLSECLSPLPFTIKYAEHPYITLNIMGVEADIVPAVKVERPRRGGLGVERTPFHTRYVKGKISGKPCIAGEVRLLKSFMEGIGVYGAETGLGGFSGYLAELLAIHYGGFLKVLEEALKWRPQVYIDPEGLGDEKFLREKYAGSPMIVVDPVDPERNAAASVTLEKLATFIIAARAYLESPGEVFFHYYAPVHVEALGPSVMVLCTGEYSEEPPENIMGKLRRLSTLTLSTLSSKGFTPTWKLYGSDYASRAAIIVGLESLRLPHLEYRRGPHPWDDVDAALKFVSKRFKEGGMAWIGDDGVLEGLRPRRHVSALKALEDLLPELKRSLKTGECRVIECEEGLECVGLSGLSLNGLEGFRQTALLKLVSTLQKPG